MRDAPGEHEQELAQPSFGMSGFLSDSQEANGAHPAEDSDDADDDDDGGNAGDGGAVIAHHQLQPGVFDDGTTGDAKTGAVFPNTQKVLGLGDVFVYCPKSERIRRH